jgi:hypothetical protein
LGQSTKRVREKYWAEGDGRIFVLDQLGKIKDITADWVIEKGKIIETKTPTWLVKEIYHIEFSLEEVSGVKLGETWWSQLYGHLYRNDQLLSKKS